MKFSKIEYSRPSIEVYESNFNAALKEFNNAKNFTKQNEILEHLYKQRDEFDTMFQFAKMKYDGDTTNEFYQNEIDYFNKILPQTDKLINNFYQSLVNTQFKDQLEKKWGSHIFNLANNKSKEFDSSIIEELTKENELKSEYTRLIGSINIDYKGNKHNLISIATFLENKNRNTRKEASAAKWNVLSDRQQQLDEIFDNLVKVRHTMATKLGFENYIELGYIRLDRIDYEREQIAIFRKHVVKYFTPIAKKLIDRQKKRLGYDNIYHYDQLFQFNSGNPSPKYHPEEILKRGQKMYADLSEETNVFFKYMMENELLDVINRPGKALGGYCWEISKYRHPYIFASFNGTSSDIKILTHETGHAFQYFCGRDINLAEYRWPSYEAAEIHSMTMEYLTYPWMESFFEEDTEKYLFAHLSSAVSLLLTGCQGDHFQHLIYESPNLSPDERAESWLNMNSIYNPSKIYKDNKYLESGRFWQIILHIYKFPFYFIDYALAKICALQYWQNSKKNKEATWNDYLKLCKAGGTLPFLELVKYGNLQSPFEEECIERIANYIDMFLDNIDDSTF